jgi:nucleotide-binding universal stress UspA family protein
VRRARSWSSGKSPQTRTGVPAGRFAGHVVVGVDGSGPARSALEFGFGYAAQHRRLLAAVNVTAHTDYDVWVDDTLLETHLTAEPAALAMLANEVEPWHHKYPDVMVKRALFAGPPLAGLLRAADGAALLCVGDRGRGPTTRALLGSVSHAAVDRAGCPVAIMHGHERRREELP